MTAEAARSPRLAALVVAVLVLLGAGVGAAAANQALQPFQMVRSLQLVQDRIAAGDHAAMPMQRKLLELVDERLRESSPTDFDDRRNFRALMIYAMSGGNPTTLETVLPRLELDADDTRLAAAVQHYVDGDTMQAQRAFAGIEPARHHREVAAFLGLLKGSVLSRDEPAQAVRYLDQARLDAPGTLVEEAALRRSVTLAVELDDAERFLRAASQYVRRFLRSPYASQFAEAFVSGIAGFAEDGIDVARVAEIVDWMSREQARAIYLRLARVGAIDGHDGLLEFASEKSGEIAAGETETVDVRSQLYASISSITSENVDRVLRKLETLETAELSEEDRDLLTAARSVAREVLAPTPEIDAAGPASSGSRDDAGADAPAQEGGENEASARADPDETEALLTRSRSRLDEIDAILERDER